MPRSSPFDLAIGTLLASGVTGGCASGSGEQYRPRDAVSRAQMAVFVTMTFGLTLYGRATTNAKEEGM